MSRDFDAIIVGSGPGGSTAADVLTAAGWSVVIFERGKNYLEPALPWTRSLAGAADIQGQPVRREAPLGRRGQQPAGHCRRRRYPRRRQGAALS
jgi:choline dehydrogenase-like flavoprotein